MKRHILIISSLALLSLAFSQSLAQENPTSGGEAEDIATKFAAPESPALDFISSSPSNISRPSNVKQLAAGLYNGIDGGGKVKQGFALEVAPFNYLGVRITPKEYRENVLKYMIYNTQLSIGTVATSGNAKNTDLGWGGRITIIDRSDPMANESYIRQFEGALALLAPSLPGGKPTDAQKNAYKDSIESIKKQWLKNQWNAGWLSIAYAGGSRLSDSQFKNGRSLGDQIVIAGGLRLQKWGQISFLGKWSNRYNDELPQKIKELKVGQRLLVGGNSFNIFEEVSYNPLLNKNDFKNSALINSKKTLSWTIGIEFRISENVWGVTGLGEDANKIVGTKGLQVLTGLRFGISDKSRLK